jgi:DNA-binding transcriptional ArsR family regulator
MLVRQGGNRDCATRPVSKHLTVLKRAKLVRHRREGRETHYRAQPDALAPMVDWLRHYGASPHAD